MPRSTIHARLLLEVAPELAQPSAQPFVEAARVLDPSLRLHCGRYWKIDNNSELTVAMTVEGQGEAGLAQLMSVVGIGWQLSGAGPERSAIWQGHGTALMPSLRWVNIEIFPRNATRPTDEIKQDTSD